MTKKKVAPPVPPVAPTPRAGKSLAPQVPPPRKRAASAVKKSVTKVVTPPLPSKRPSVSKVQASADKSAKPAAAKTKSRSPARSSARPPSPTQTRKSSRVKAKALPTTPDVPLKVEPKLTDDVLSQEAIALPKNTQPDITPAEKPVPEAATPPVLSVDELWEQGSPIKNRIAQLKTRNSLLEEQLQRLRPPVLARGKKK